jgi:hypothetical protein
MAGILAALATGRLDELDGRLPEERDLPPMTGSDRRAMIRRDKRRARMLANRAPF